MALDIAAQTPDNTLQASLAPLREDLKILPGSRQPDGSPTWTLHDPVRHSFFKIGWIEFEILCRWHLGNAQYIFDKIGQETTLQLQKTHIESVFQFLSINNLLQNNNSDILHDQWKSIKNKKLFPLLIKNYLYLKIPIFRPDSFLQKTLPTVRSFFNPLFFILFTFISIAGLFFSIRQWDSFQNTFLYFFTIEGITYYALALTLVKILHELGHAYTAKHYGLKIPSMGIAFILFWPVLFTDTSDAWKLKNKNKRIKIAAAGVCTELGVALIATFLWSFLPNGTIKSVAFILATTTWIATIAVNLNPFMKFDGYYLFADWIDIPNLQQRSFTLARWWLRRLLFGLPEPCPENLHRSQQKTVLIYAFATWVYRIILFTGIALMVYHFTIKLLGIFLMALELFMFIGLPIFRELKLWWGKRSSMKLTVNLFCTTTIFIGLIAFLFLPFPISLEVPALYKSESYAHIYPPDSARLEKILIKKGAMVKKGDLMFVFHNPTLEFNEKLARIETDKLKIKQQRINFVTDQSDNIQIVEQQLTQALTALSGFRQQLDNLEVRSSIDGIVVELDQSLNPGRWINEKERLALIIDKNASVVEGMIHEDDFNYTHQGQTGKFYPDELEAKPFSVIIKTLEEQGISTLSAPYLASTFGGPIPVHVKNSQFISPESYYRVVFSLPDNSPQIDHILRGTVRLSGRPMNIFQRAWPHIAKIFIRESGF